MIRAYLVRSAMCGICSNTAKAHFLRIANRYNLPILEYTHSGFYVSLAGEVNGCEIETNGETLIIQIYQGDEIGHDRFLKIFIGNNKLTIENDYAGSIPCFYSSKNGFVASNIEPCVYLASGTTLDDVSPENVFGYLKYSHFIWDETAWKHIYQTLPDSRYIFAADGQLASSEYLETVKATTSRVTLSDKDVAGQLFDLNCSLVKRSLSKADDIILPLSSGYDSRMIFAVLANEPSFAKKLRCYTYGSEGSIEVEGGRRLTHLKNIYWKHIELPCNFLQRRYLNEISDIFGASLHMHGMYQLEFYEQIKSIDGIPQNSVLTSGFMTGVPAGQHNGLLQIENTGAVLVQAMNRFSQSKVWSDGDLKLRPLFANNDYLEIAESRFRAAFDRFNGEVFQKAVIFDVWTRQRNFISYYPRTLEWVTTVISPHMNAEYANYFMSLSRSHLWDRKAVELMFLHHYPDISCIASNSNGLAAIGSSFETALFFVSKILSRLRIADVLPKQYRNTAFDFDTQAVVNAEHEAFYPLLSGEEKLRDFIENMGGEAFFLDCYERARTGDTKAYAQIVTIQSLALNGLLI